MHSSAYQAIISGSDAVAQGSGIVAADEKGIVVGRDVRDLITVTQPDVIPYNAAFERVVGSTTFVLSQLKLSYRQTREQAQGWFRFSLVSAVAGFILVGIGVVAVILGQTTAGVITTISSIIPDVVAALFFAQSKTENERVDTIQEKLTDAWKVQVAVEIVDTIDDSAARDKLKAEIVRKTLRIEQGDETVVDD